MEETNNKTLENLIETVTESKLPNWAKTTIAVSAGITPLLKILVPLMLVRLLADVLFKLLGL
jgi:hypothetical protein